MSKNWQLDREQRLDYDRKRFTRLKNALAKLTPEERELIADEFERRAKTKGVA